MIDFSRRDPSKELMDDFDLADDVLALTLKEIAYINRVLGGDQVTLSAMEKAMKQIGQKTASVADLGCGRGALMALLEDWSEKKGVSLELTGIDASAFTLEEAKKAQQGRDFRFLHLNALNPALNQYHFDVVNATLFCHHLRDDELLQVFQWAKTNSKVMIINDLHRHPFAFYSIRLLTHWFSKSAMVKNDAPLSVLRAFRRADLESLLKAAGYRRFEISWRWAFRWRVLAWA
jgi:SAM-dependent methyltransferase